MGKVGRIVAWMSIPLLQMLASSPVVGRDYEGVQLHLGAGISVPVSEFYHKVGYTLGGGFDIPLSPSVSIILNLGYNKLPPLSASDKDASILTINALFELPVGHVGSGGIYLLLGGGIVSTSVMHRYGDKTTANPALFLGGGFDIPTNTLLTLFVEGTFSIFSDQGEWGGVFFPVRAGVKIPL